MSPVFGALCRHEEIAVPIYLCLSAALRQEGIRNETAAPVEEAALAGCCAVNGWW